MASEPATIIQEVSDLRLRLYGHQDRKINIMLMNFNPEQLSGKKKIFNRIEYVIELLNARTSNRC